MEPFIGQIQLFGFGFAPAGWAYCDGSLMQISSNTALFSLLGTAYGGDGKTTFGLPDLRGRVPLAQGTGPGLPAYTLGQNGGSPTVTLTQANMPSHGHAVNASATASSKSPASAVPAFTSEGTSYGAGDGTKMADAMIGNSGSNQPFNSMPPYLTMNWCIAVEGIYPSRP